MRKVAAAAVRHVPDIDREESGSDTRANTRVADT
jgi:hypothetical protein